MGPGKCAEILNTTTVLVTTKSKNSPMEINTTKELN